MRAPHTLGIVGAGRLGTAVARLALRAGLEVCIAGTSDPAVLADRLAREAPGAQAGALSDAAACDAVVLALPLRRLRELDPAALAGRVVIDATNHVPLWDGPVPGVAAASSSSEYVQAHLAGARVVKTLNHLGADELEHDAAPPGTPGRRALGVAGDDLEAVRTALTLVERLGFDAVEVGPLAAGVGLEPNSAVFNGLYDGQELAAMFNRPVPPTPPAPPQRAEPTAAGRLAPIGWGPRRTPTGS
ncbi:MAG: NAD(P)-binding domain-containing protein, partial [Actinomycetes bacterium]|nr:NAD(P)-binding domain-containing protein [Actinomycetes bacterium]MDX5380272.1 NAD(P)-binding domain-containing protein [Actinomycetes bacterium]MDX5398990.1 NAD(P)-binding domain-containing protein [Actinomycetes bacterium]MDX5449999.1 NAD(P)-binding domain-containing protein [Actinomycetes bacterium]